jgi:hypothetical protein
MRVVERIFRKTCQVGARWCGGSLYFCGEVFEKLLHGVWQLPEDLNKVTLSLHDRASPDRLEVRVTAEGARLEGESFPWIKVKANGVNEKVEDEKLDNVLWPYVDKSLYLQVEYDARADQVEELPET